MDTPKQLELNGEHNKLEIFYKKIYREHRWKQEFDYLQKEVRAETMIS